MASKNDKKINKFLNIIGMELFLTYLLKPSRFNINPLELKV